MLLFKKEKQVIELILKHLDLVEETLKTGIRTTEFDGFRHTKFPRDLDEHLFRRCVAALRTVQYGAVAGDPIGELSVVLFGDAECFG